MVLWRTIFRQHCVHSSYHPAPFGASLIDEFDPADGVNPTNFRNARCARSWSACLNPDRSGGARYPHLPPIAIIRPFSSPGCSCAESRPFPNRNPDRSVKESKPRGLHPLCSRELANGFHRHTKSTMPDRGGGGRILPFHNAKGAVRKAFTDIRFHATSTSLGRSAVFPATAQAIKCHGTGRWIGGPIPLPRPFHIGGRAIAAFRHARDMGPARHARTRRKDNKSTSIPKVIHTAPRA